VFLVNSCQRYFSCGPHHFRYFHIFHDEERRISSSFLSRSHFVIRLSSSVWKYPKWWGQALFRSYGCFFAEFLGDVSLVRLRLLDENTCVGLRYGYSYNKFRDFSWKMALHHLPGRGRTFPLFLESVSKPAVRIFLDNFLKARTSNPIMRDAYSSSSSHHLQEQSRNINRVSIGCGSHHSLRTD
jgi:hypothetical protein